MKQNFTTTSKAIAAFILFSLLHTTGNAQIQQQLSILTASQNNRVEATVIRGAVAISWPAGSSLKNNDFVIERSFNQTDFKSICYVFAADSPDFAESLTHYKDGSIELNGKSIAYYRIKQTDKYNNVTYSDVITVALK